MSRGPTQGFFLLLRGIFALAPVAFVLASGGFRPWAL